MITGYSNNPAKFGARRGDVRILDHRFKGDNRIFVARMQTFTDRRIWSTNAVRFNSEAEADLAVKKFLEAND